MKRLLTITVLGMMLSSMAGCRFMECLFRGPACQQQTAVAAPVTYANPCPAYTTPAPCDTGCSAAPAVVGPGPATN